jgi:hypothetical protein
LRSFCLRPGWNFSKHQGTKGLGINGVRAQLSMRCIISQMWKDKRQPVVIATHPADHSLPEVLRASAGTHASAVLPPQQVSLWNY